MDDLSDLRAWIDHRSEAAFARIVDRHAPMVLATCRRELGTASDADDAAQAVFLICARRAHTVSPPQRLVAWLFGVSMRVCSTARRTAARRRRHELAITAVSNPAPAPANSWDEIRPRLNRALGALSPDQRAVIVEHFLEGVSQPAVAARLGISTDAAKMRIHYALGKLRTWFRQRGMVLSDEVFLGGVAWDHVPATRQLSDQLVRIALHPEAASAAVQGLAQGSAAQLVLAVGAKGLLLLLGMVVAVLGLAWSPWERVHAVGVASSAATAMAREPRAPTSRIASGVPRPSDPLDQIVSIRLPPVSLTTALSSIAAGTPAEARMLWTVPDGMKSMTWVFRPLLSPPYITFDGSPHTLREDLDRLATLTQSRWRPLPPLAPWSTITIAFEQDREDPYYPSDPFARAPQPWTISQIAVDLPKHGYPQASDFGQSPWPARHGRAPLPYTVAAAHEPAVQHAVLAALTSDIPFIRSWATRTAAAMQMHDAASILRGRPDHDSLVALGCIGDAQDVAAWCSELPRATGGHALDVIAALAEARSTPAIAVLVQEATRALQPSLRAAAARALAPCGSDADLAVLETALMHEVDPEAAFALAHTLQAQGRTINHRLALAWLARPGSRDLTLGWIQVAAAGRGTALPEEMAILEGQADRVLLDGGHTTAPASLWDQRAAWLGEVMPRLTEVGEAPGLIPALAQVAASQAPGARMAMAALAASWRETAGTALREVSSRITDPRQRDWAMSAMLACANETTRSQALTSIAHDEDAADALLTLQETTDPLEMNQLVAIAVGRAPVANRARALLVLRGPYNTESTAALSALAQSDPHSWMRAIALSKLTEDRLNRLAAAGGAEAQPDVPEPVAPSLVLHALLGPTPFERWYGLHAIAQTHRLRRPIDSALQARCVELITSDPDPRVRHYAITSAFWQRMDADQAITMALSDPAPAVRLVAVRLMQHRLSDTAHPLSPAHRTAALQAVARDGASARNSEGSTTINVTTPEGTTLVFESAGQGASAAAPGGLDTPKPPAVVPLAPTTTVPVTEMMGTMDMEPEWCPADFGETDPQLFPGTAAPSGQG